MITAQNLIDATNILVVAAIPSLKKVHINPPPKDFDRPAAWIECPKYDRRTVNRKTVEVTAYLTITYYGAVDKHYISDVEELNAAQASILSIFKSGYIAVGDRNLKCESSEGYTGFDASSVDVQFNFFDDRGETAEVLPLMGSVKTNIKQEG